jgi:hypothetical protein
VDRGSFIGLLPGKPPTIVPYQPAPNSRAAYIVLFQTQQSMKYILNDVNKRRLGFLVVAFAMRLDIALNIKTSLPRGRAAAVVNIEKARLF